VNCKVIDYETADDINCLIKAERALKDDLQKGGADPVFLKALKGGIEFLKEISGTDNPN
jgi:hypothetical protein